MGCGTYFAHRSPVFHLQLKHLWWKIVRQLDTLQICCLSEWTVLIVRIIRCNSEWTRLILEVKKGGKNMVDLENPC